MDARREVGDSRVVIPHRGGMFAAGLTLVLVSGVCAAAVLFIDVPDSLPDALQISPHAWEFGSVTAGSEVKHGFHLENTSDVPIDLVRAIGNCGCVALARMEGIVMEPGQSRELPLRWRVGKRTGPASVLMMVEYTRRGTDDGRPPLIERKVVQLTANVIPAEG